MNYPVESRPAPSNAYFTPAQSNAYYKARYAREGITVHWWGGGETADKHDGIVSYFLQQGKQGVKSVNFVVSDGKITQMVDPDNVAWCSQAGNPTTISIEFQPTLSAEGYKRGGWLIDQLEKRYGHSMSLYPHNHWAATGCPGTIDINRLRQEANNFKNGVYDEMILPNNDEYYNKMNLLHVQLLGEPVDRATYAKGMAGVDFVQMINYMSAVDPRAGRTQAWQDVGKRATEENWAQQMADLKAQAAELSKRPTQENFNKLQDSLNACTIDLSTAKQEQASDKAAGDGFLRRLGQFLKKYLP